METDPIVPKSDVASPYASDSSSRVVRVGDLGELIRKKRKAENLTLEQAAKQSGVSAATLSRWQRQRLASSNNEGATVSHEPDMRTLAAITRWLGVSLENLIDVDTPRPGHEVVHRETDTVPDIVTAHLRADRNLDRGTAEALARFFRSAYEQFAELGASEKNEDPNRNHAEE